MVNSTKWDPDTLELFYNDARNTFRNNDFYLVVKRLDTAYGVFKSKYFNNLRAPKAPKVKTGPKISIDAEAKRTRRATKFGRLQETRRSSEGLKRRTTDLPVEDETMLGGRRTRRHRRKQ